MSLTFKLEMCITTTCSYCHRPLHFVSWKWPEYTSIILFTNCTICEPSKVTSALFLTCYHFKNIYLFACLF